MDDRLYFRQLLSGRDFARDDQVAVQMVNFVYAIGDRATGECVLVDPAYSIDELYFTDGVKRPSCWTNWIRPRRTRRSVMRAR